MPSGLARSTCSTRHASGLHGSSLPSPSSSGLIQLGTLMPVLSPNLRFSQVSIWTESMLARVGHAAHSCNSWLMMGANPARDVGDARGRISRKLHASYRTAWDMLERKGEGTSTYRPHASSLVRKQSTAYMQPQMKRGCKLHYSAAAMRLIGRLLRGAYSCRDQTRWGSLSKSSSPPGKRMVAMQVRE